MPYLRQAEERRASKLFLVKTKGRVQRQLDRHKATKGNSGWGGEGRPAEIRTEDYCNTKTASSVNALDGNTVSKFC